MGDEVIEEYYEEFYPEWLGNALVEDNLPWDKASEMTFQAFSQKYTLHDSGWVKLIYNIAYEQTAILIIHWDSVWLPDEIAKSTGVVEEWPLLFIAINGVKQISTSGYEDIGRLQRGISYAEIQEVEGKQLLIITDHYGGNVEIVFQGSMKFLALDGNKILLNI